MTKIDDSKATRVTFTTSLNPDLLKRFKIYCAVRSQNMNEVLEQLISKLLIEEGDSVEHSDK